MLGEVAVSTAGVAMLCWVSKFAVSTAGVMLCWGKYCRLCWGKLQYCRCNVVLGEVAVSTAGVMLCWGSCSTAGVMLCWGKLQCLLCNVVLGVKLQCLLQV